jgi:hypothetical protein
MRLRFALTALVLASASFPATDVLAQNCTSAPKCSAANARANSYVNQLKGTSGIHDSASQAYCANMVAADVMQVCAAEYQAMGNSTCASALQQAANGHLSTAAEAKQTAQQTKGTGGSMNSPWKSFCRYQ